jgi:DNA-binding transcriptional ArsR family regulator
VQTSAPPLLPVFRSRLVGDLLALTLLDPERRWTTDELATRTGATYPTLTRELRRLGQAGLLATEGVGRSNLWRANDRNPHFRALTELVAGSFGPPQVLAEEFGDVPGIDDLYIYGSWAARAGGEPGPVPRDIDVLVLGRPSRRAVYDAARRAEGRLGREVNPTIRPVKEWREADDGFARQLKSSPMFRVDGPWSAYAPGDAEVEAGRGDNRANAGTTRPRSRASRR